MEIFIQNFKGIRNGNYKFQNNSTTLISAPSGSGKSSILYAFNYVICGDNSRGLANMSSDGKIMVKLVISSSSGKTIEIIRTNKPKKVIFKEKGGEKEYNEYKEYEDEIAQNYIDNYFTIFFKDIGYIRQKGVSTFLQKTSTEKMEFLRMWTTQDKSIQTMKTKLKEYTKKVSNESDQLNIKNEVSKQIYDKQNKEFNLNYEKVQNPIPKNIDAIEYQKKQNKKLKKLKYIFNENVDNINEYNDILKNKEKIIRKNMLKKYENINVDELNDKLIFYSFYYDNYENKDIIMENITIDELKKQRQELLLYESELINYNKKLNTYNEYEKQIKTKSIITNIILELYEEYKEQLNVKKEEEKYYNELIEYSRKYHELYLQQLDIINFFEKQDNIIGVIFSKGDSEEEDGKLSLSFTMDFFNLFNIYIRCPCCSSSLEISNDKYDVKISEETNCENTSDTIKLEKDIKKKYEQYMNIKNEMDNILKNGNHKILNAYPQNKIKLNKIKTTINKLENKISIIESNCLNENCLNDDNEENEIEISYTSLNDLITKLNEIKRIEIYYNELKEELKKYNNLTTTTTKQEIDKRLKDNFLKISIKEKYESISNKFEFDLTKTKEEILNNINETKYIIECNKEFNYLNKFDEGEGEDGGGEVNFDELEETIKDLQKENEDIMIKMNEIENFKLNIELYNKYIKAKKEITKLKNESELNEKEYNDKKRENDNCAVLKLLIEKTEANVIDMFIYELNEKIQYYIDQFFVEYIMNIDIRCIRTKKELPKIIFNINYKGNLIEDVKLLSGGEYDRLQLAISLSFADLHSLPLLLLDETVNSLDEELCSNVLEKIKTGNRITLVVAHQVEEGIFDNVLKIN